AAAPGARPAAGGRGAGAGAAEAEVRARRHATQRGRFCNASIRSIQPALEQLAVFGDVELVLLAVEHELDLVDRLAALGVALDVGDLAALRLAFDGRPYGRWQL